MTLFTTLSRRRVDKETRGAEPMLPERVRRSLPRHFEAVGEALLAGGGVADACAVVGRNAAREGASLAEALSALRSTCTGVLGQEPDFEATEALSIAWSEETLEYLHDLTCEDPLTGLASMAHVRTRLAELYREAEVAGTSVQDEYALVVVELAFQQRFGVQEHHLTRAMRLTHVGETLRSVYQGGETVGRLGQERVVAVVRRTEDLGASTVLLDDCLADLDFGAADVRSWIEGLPAGPEAVSRLVDELAR